MSLALPTLRGTAQQALYPFKRTIKCSTLVTTNQDGSQQRSILSSPRVLFDLPFTRLNPADKNSVKALAASALGQNATNETLTLGNVTYTNLSLDSDLYSGKVRATTMWDSGLKLSQTQAQNLRPTTTLGADVLIGDTSITVASVAGFNGYITIGTETMLITWTPDSTHFTVSRGQLGTTAATHTSGDTVSWGPAFALGAALPAFPNTTRTQIPWQQNQQYKTEVSSMEAGPKWTYPWYGGHLIAFPTEGLRQWVIGGDMLTDAETALLEAHFLANWGRFSSFTFTDPETLTTYEDAYYTTDEMVIEYIEPNVNRVSLTVEAYQQGSGAVSAVLTCITAHNAGPDTAGNACITLGSFAVLGAGTVIFDPSTYAKRTNTSSWAGTTWSASIGPLYSNPNPIDMFVNFYTFQSLAGTNSPPDEYLIYDCYMDVTFSDGTTSRYRPTAYVVVPNAHGTVVNPGNAIDGDDTTFAQINQNSYTLGGLTFCQLVLLNFSLSA